MYDSERGKFSLADEQFRLMRWRAFEVCSRRAGALHDSGEHICTGAISGADASRVAIGNDNQTLSVNVKFDSALCAACTQQQQYHRCITTIASFVCNVIVSIGNNNHDAAQRTACNFSSMSLVDAQQHQWQSKQPTISNLSILTNLTPL